MDASEIHGKRPNAKEVLTPMKGEKFIFPIADGTVKLSGNLRGKLDGSSSTPRQDSWYDGEAKNDFWSISDNFIYRHHNELSGSTLRAERRIISCSTGIH